MAIFAAYVLLAWVDAEASVNCRSDEDDDDDEGCREDETPLEDVAPEEAAPEDDEPDATDDAMDDDAREDTEDVELAADAAV